MANQVYISHHLKDAKIADIIYKELEKNNISSFMVENVKGDWSNSIENAIEEAEIFLLILSKDSSKSSLTTNECRKAKKFNKPPNKKKIIIFKIDDVELKCLKKGNNIDYLFIDATKASEKYELCKDIIDFNEEDKLEIKYDDYIDELITEIESSLAFKDEKNENTSRNTGIASVILVILILIVLVLIALKLIKSN